VRSSSGIERCARRASHVHGAREEVSNQGAQTKDANHHQYVEQGFFQIDLRHPSYLPAQRLRQSSGISLAPG